jgi:O-methyltransferase involved in polyketide biosynthesis
MAAAGLHLTKEPVLVDLSGVSATLLSNLARRAAAARARRPLLDDPLAVEAVERLDYDFADGSVSRTGFDGDRARR